MPEGGEDTGVIGHRGHRACRYVGPVGSEPGFGFKVGVAERVYLLNTKVTYMTYILT
jgi:hypothetical protein